MCGIAGILDFSGLEREYAECQIQAMTGVLEHRGPDAAGIHVDTFAALGHRRLSIIDLAGGEQPMSAMEGRLQIVFNGEIYNYRELRQNLKAIGYRFRTESDTEVILVAYAHWGEECVVRLNGMFAFAIWDKVEGKLFLARDRVGKKPLYYFQKGTLFAFASELKSLRQLASCPTEVDAEALDCYLSMGYIPAPMSIYKNVRKLPAANVLSITAKAVRGIRYWDLRFPEPRKIGLADAVAELDSLLDKAVECRLMSEVPIGAFLSAGIDSSLVVSAMSRLMDEPVRTNTVGFASDAFDESDAARKIAEHVGADHREYRIEPDAASVLDQIAWHCDEPFGDSSALPTWYVCQVTRRSVTVALSGDGGDEAFGGYSFRYLPHIFESRIRSRLPATLRAALFGPLGAVWPSSARLPKVLRLKSILENLATSDSHAFYSDLIWLREDMRQGLYRPEFLENLKGFTPFEVVDKFYRAPNGRDPLGRSRYTDVNVYMTDDVLVKVDRMSMAHGLEVRAPLMDYRMFEFAASLPQDLLVSGREGKKVLRSLATQRLPRGISDLPKRGFSIPASDWLRAGLKERAGDAIFNHNGLIANFLNRSRIERHWTEHQSGSRDHSVFLWALMMLGIWDELFQ